MVYPKTEISKVLPFPIDHGNLKWSKTAGFATCFMAFEVRSFNLGAAFHYDTAVDAKDLREACA
jgi:hypothetical protein